MTYRIRNWAKFQHFKDRNPPWVKLYKDILDDPDWHELDPLAAKVLVMLWLIASEDDTKQGALPEIKKLAFRLRISEKNLCITLSQLKNWLIQDDIAVISPRYHADAPERAGEETETETETEGETEPAAKIAADGKPFPSRPAKFDPNKINLPETIDAGVWELWISYRRQRRLSCARMCVEQQLANLSAWADDGYDPGEIIRASIANGWQGLFEPKTKPAQKPLAGKSKARLNHLGVVEELQSFGGINSWASTGYTSIAEYEAAQKESA